MWSGKKIKNKDYLKYDIDSQTIEIDDGDKEESKNIDRIYNCHRYITSKWSVRETLGWEYNKRNTVEMLILCWDL